TSKQRSTVIAYAPFNRRFSPCSSYQSPFPRPTSPVIAAQPTLNPVPHRRQHNLHRHQENPPVIDTLVISTTPGGSEPTPQRNHPADNGRRTKTAELSEAHLPITTPAKPPTHHPIDPSRQSCPKKRSAAHA